MNLEARVLEKIKGRDWDGLKPLLHPYLHWTSAAGRTVRGRTKVLAYLAAARVTNPPRDYEVRDAQIYRWVEAG